MPYASLPGIDLYYESHGEGPAVTFLHGAGGNHISWWQQVPTFSAQYRCITFDHRGFGRSVDAERLGSGRYVEDLVALLDHLDVARTALVAQSMGGLAALGLAVRHPERVSCLVMADNWGWFDDAGLRERWNALRIERTESPPAPGGIARRYRAENPRGVFLYQQIAALNPPREPGVPFLEGGAVTRRDVARLETPVLWLVGAEDPTVPPEIVRTMHELTPGSEYVEIDGCGHSVYFEDAPAFNRAVGAFLARHVR
ncbi:MAG: alpha/beta hydrolase [Dehalococcoidia bacterium]|nr:alpha/beta hydrolase [Dehalococcoidia bacterium]